MKFEKLQTKKETKTERREEETPFEKTTRMLADLERNHQTFASSSKDFEIPDSSESDKDSVALTDKRAKKDITYKRDSSVSRIIIKDSGEAEGDETLEYVANTDNEDNEAAGTIYVTEEKKGREGLVKINLRNGKARFREIEGEYAIDLEDDGLHIGNDEQGEWDRAWRNFQLKLSSDEKFSAFINREIDRGATTQHEVITGSKIEDAKKYLDEMEELWNAVQGTALLKKKFPRKKAPLKLGETRPPDTVIPHKEIQKRLLEILKPLTRAFRELDEKFYKPSKTRGPYR